MTYDFFAEEWFGACGACNLELYAPTKGEYLMQRMIHTRSEKCLGGY